MLVIDTHPPAATTSPSRINTVVAVVGVPSNESPISSPAAAAVLTSQQPCYHHPFSPSPSHTNNDNSDCNDCNNNNTRAIGQYDNTLTSSRRHRNSDNSDSSSSSSKSSEVSGGTNIISGKNPLVESISRPVIADLSAGGAAELAAAAAGSDWMSQDGEHQPSPSVPPQPPPPQNAAVPAAHPPAPQPDVQINYPGRSADLPPVAPQWPPEFYRRAPPDLSGLAPSVHTTQLHDNAGGGGGAVAGPTMPVPFKTSGGRRSLALQLRAATWASDSHGLFDYESRNSHQKSFKCLCMRDIYHLVRVGTDIQFVDADQSLHLLRQEPRARLLAQVVWDSGYYRLLPGNAPPHGRSTSTEKLWLVIRPLKERGVGLMEGDVLKLGRFRLRMKELVVSPQEAQAAESRPFLRHEDDDCETVAPDVDRSLDPLDIDNGSAVYSPVGSVAPLNHGGVPQNLGQMEGRSSMSRDRVSDRRGESFHTSSGTGGQGRLDVGRSDVERRSTEPQQQRGTGDISPPHSSSTARVAFDDAQVVEGGNSVEQQQQQQPRVDIESNSVATTPEDAARIVEEQLSGAESGGQSSRAQSVDGAAETARFRPAAAALSDTTRRLDGGTQDGEGDEGRLGAVMPAEGRPLAATEAPQQQQQQLLRSRSSNSQCCRICLCEVEDEEGNPLISPCCCKGSMRWVHLVCLRTWMEGRLNIRNDGTTVSFFWRSLECELCKVPYPTFVTVGESPWSGKTGSEAGGGQNNIDPPGALNLSSAGPGTDSKMPPRNSQRPSLNASGKAPSDGAVALSPLATLAPSRTPRIIELFEVPRPAVPYVILEPRISHNRGLHIVSLAKRRAARLGRGHESDIRLSDISVSRLHAVLKFQQIPGRRPPSRTTLVCSTGVGCLAPNACGFFVIEDHRSKFGTLLEIRQGFKLEPNIPISVQIGRTVAVFQIKRRWHIIPSCFRHPEEDIRIVEPAPSVTNPTGSRLSMSSGGSAVGAQPGLDSALSGRQSPSGHLPSMQSPRGNIELTHAAAAVRGEVDGAAELEDLDDVLHDGQSFDSDFAEEEAEAREGTMQPLEGRQLQQPAEGRPTGPNQLEQVDCNINIVTASSCRTNVLPPPSTLSSAAGALNVHSVNGANAEVERALPISPAMQQQQGSDRRIDL